MPFSRPTLNQLRERIGQDFSGHLLDGAPLRRASVLRVLAWVWAGACHLMYGFFAWLTGQALPDSAENEFLRRWAAVWAVLPKPAAYASGQVSLSGTDGSIVPAGSLLKASAGQVYRVSEDALLSGAAAPVSLRALEPGENGNLDPGETLTLVQPIAGVVSSGPVISLTGGTDPESDASLRARLLAVIRKPPHGGNADDYVHWALQVPEVTRAWCLPLYAGPGTVGLTFVCDELPDIIPDPEKIAEMLAHILALCPVTARPGVIVFAPQVLDIDISLHLNPDTAAVRAAVERELADLLTEAEVGQIIYLSHINAAISNAPGELDHVLLTPAANIIPAAHQLPMLGEVTYE
jgi:uncharacterized phage protein gp47/JayE